MTRLHVRAFFVALVVAVCATGAVAEEVDAQDMLVPPVVSPKISMTTLRTRVPMLGESNEPAAAGAANEPAAAGAANATPAAPADAPAGSDVSGLDKLRQQNEQALAKIKHLQELEKVHRSTGQIAAEQEKQRQEKEEAKDEAQQDIKTEKEQIKNVEEKIQTADSATQIMKQIMDISSASQEKVRELREKLKSATSEEAAKGAEEATTAQEEAVTEEGKTVEKITAKLTSLMNCADCKDKDQHVATLQENLAIAKKALERKIQQKKSIEVAAKASVQKAAQGKVKELQDQMGAAKKKLGDLEKQAIEANEEEAAAGMAPVKLTKSSQTDIAEVAVHDEAKKAVAAHEKAQKNAEQAKDEMVHMVERRMKAMDEAEDAKAASSAEGKTNKVVGKVKAQLDAAQTKYEAQKLSVEKDAKKLKAMALQAAAHGDLEKLTEVQKETAKALSDLKKTEKDIVGDNDALAEAKEWGILELVHTKASAQAKVAEKMAAAKKVAEKSTSPELQQKQANAAEKEKTAQDELVKLNTQLLELINSGADAVADASTKSGAIIGETLKKKKEEAAKAQEAALKEKAEGVAEPSQANKIATKLERIQNELSDASDELAKAQAKAEHRGEVALEIAKQAAIPDSDKLAIAQQMVAKIGALMGDISAAISNDATMTEVNVEKMNGEVSGLQFAKNQLQETIKGIHEQQANRDEAKQQQADAQLALQFRGAAEKVEKALARRKENGKKVEATNKLMLKIDQKMAAEESQMWQRKETAKIAGPSVSELVKEKSEISVKIALAKKDEKEEDETVDKIEKANMVVDQMEGKMNKLKEELQAAQKKVHAMPTEDSPERQDALAEVEHLSEQELAAQNKVEESKAEAKNADKITPKLDAVKKSIDKFYKHLDSLKYQRSKLKESLELKEVNMKKDAKDPKALKESSDAVIKTKESLAKVDADYQTTERNLDKARTEKGGYDRVLKMAADKIARERSEKVDAKNKWVKDMVNYAQQEKGMKSVGADATEKHFKSLKQKNDQKEIGHKGEVSVKMEKTAKAEEVKNKAAKRVEEKEKEEAQKGQEKENKEEIAGKEKTRKEGVAGELKNKKAAEEKAKIEAKVEMEQKAEVATKQAEKEQKAWKAFSENFELAKESKNKKTQELEEAKQAEITGRTTSEAAKKIAVKKIDDDIAAAAGTANEAQVKSNRPELVSKEETKEENAKKALADAKQKALDDDAAAQKEFVTGKEVKDKASKKEAEAKATENALREEMEQKSVEEKKNKESAAKNKEKTSKKEAEDKKTHEAAAKVHSLELAKFTDAHTKLKFAHEVQLDIQNKYNENAAKYEKFAKERAANDQRNANKELAKAKQELAKDEDLFHGAKTRQEQRIFSAQVAADQRILKEKQTVADRDANLVDHEKAGKKKDLEAEMAATNTMKRTETVYDGATKAEEKISKSEKMYKKNVERMHQDQETAEKLVEKYQKSADLAKDAQAKASNEALFKEARRNKEMALNKVKEVTTKLSDVKGHVEVEGAKNEEKAKEAQVKEKTSKFDKDKADQAVRAAMKDRVDEIKKKQADRSNAASARHLAVKQAQDLRIEEFKSHAEQAMKTVQHQTTEKGLKKALLDEKAEKKELKSAKSESEVLEKGGANELNRKKDDKDLFVQLEEKEQKTRQLRVVADEAANKASDSQRKQLDATKQERESEEMNSKAVEKAAKMERLIPGVESGDAPNTNKTIADTEMSTPSPSPEPQREPETSDTNIKSEEEKIEDTDNNPGVTPAQNFTSVYDKLAIDEEEGSMRRRRSWHRRRRWVPPRVKEEKKAVKGEEGADAEKSDVKKGFSASFWSKVVDVKTVGDAIFKVSNIPPAIKETVDTINYPHTDGYWIGLNADFQNNFVARFRGHVNVPTNGTYTFFVTSDDGAILYVNGNAVVKNDGVKSEMGMGKGELKLDSGIADIVVDFFTGVGKSGLKVEWKGPGMEEREALSAKYVHSPKHFESLGESVTGDELKSEVSAESALAQMTQGSMQSDGVVDLRATEAELLNQVVPLTR